jgi:hypothetical protein
MGITAERQVPSHPQGPGCPEHQEAEGPGSRELVVLASFLLETAPPGTQRQRLPPGPQQRPRGPRRPEHARRSCYTAAGRYEEGSIRRRGHLVAAATEDLHLQRGGRCRC